MLRMRIARGQDQGNGAKESLTEVRAVLEG
jgi:hypothetical protein